MKFILVFLFVFLISCNKSNVDGILINESFTQVQSREENDKLALLIEKVLEKDSTALSELIEFDCGGASFCYDLGSVLTQIIYRIGENDFIRMTEKLNEEQKQNLKEFVVAGLEYGFQLDQGSENKKFENQFPKLYKHLQ